MTHPNSDNVMIGIDAGGTRTRALAACGPEFRRAQAGPGNFSILGLEGVLELFAGLLSDLRVDTSRATLCAALAGAGRPPEQERLVAELMGRGLVAQAHVVSDARAALEGAHTGGAGIIAIAGTGSIVMGRNDLGDIARAGGWGPLLGDESSAYGIVMAGLRAAGQDHDGSGPSTRLKDALLKGLDLATWDELIPRLYGGDLVRERLAGACPIVFRVAREGDDVARQIIAAEARRLGQQVCAVARRLGLPSAPVALAGGLGDAEGDWLWEQMQSDIGEGPSLHRVEARWPPVGGALLLAFTHAGQPAPDLSVDLFGESPDHRSGHRSGHKSGDPFGADSHSG